MIQTNLANQRTSIRITLPAMHKAQATIKRGAGRYNIICAGRRFGKDVLGQDRAVFFALKKAAPVFWAAPSYRMLSDNFRMLSNTLAPVITRKLNNERIDLVSGGYIDFWSLEQPDRMRGHKYLHGIVNEAAMVAILEDVFHMVIAPTLIDLRGSCDFYSTPKGLNGFYRFFIQAVDLQGWERFKYSTYDNPTIPRDEIDSMVAMLPERVVKQEIMADFLEDGAFFQNVNKAAIIERRDIPEHHAGHYLVMGVDWALSQDYTVLTVACRDCNRVVDWDRFNQLDFTYQREKLVNLADRWKAYVLAERNSIGEPNLEMLAGRITLLPGPDGKVGFNTTATTKPALIQSLANALEHDGFLIPMEYADELQSYQVETLLSGHPKFSAPEGAHDDRVISLALAWQAMSRVGVFFA